MQELSGATSRAQPRARTTGGTIGLCLILLWTYGDRPLVGEPWQWADDGLYLRQAEAFVRWIHGDAIPWLGPYDALLLGKAPLFSIWMGVVHILNFQLRLAEFALLLALPWLFRAAVRPIIALSWWQLAAIAIILVGLPFLPLEQRLLRSALQAALGSACLISATGLIVRARRSDPGLAAWAALSGLFFGLSYLNREESVWLLPAVTAAAGSILVGAWWHRAWARSLRVALCMVAAFAVPVGVVAALNHHYYGIFVTTVRRAPEFTRAHQTMTRLEPESRERYVPIRAATRMKAYALSPTFARLRDYLEGPATDGVATYPSHLALNGRPPGTREFFVSNFEFVLREAAFQAGARTAPESEAMFARIDTELEAAIAAGKVTAGNAGPATLAAPLPGDYRRIVKQTAVSLRKLYTMDSMDWPGTGMSSGTPQDLQRIENLTEMATAPVKELKAVDLPEVGGGMRVELYKLITVFEMTTYAVASLVLVAFGAATVAGQWRVPGRVEQAVAGLVLASSVVAYSFSMAVVDVLGFPILPWGASYNSLGYTGLSVLAAFGMVILFSWARRTGDPAATLS